MATQRKSSSGGASRISLALFSGLAGLFAGLLIAAVVAFSITHAPVPFVDHATREATAPLTPSSQDPNQELNGGTVSITPQTPQGNAQPGDGQRPADPLGALIATLPPAPPPSSDGQPAGRPASPATAPAGRPADLPVPVPDAPATPSANANTSKTTYYLQAGAFRGQSDADALRARILMLGLPVALQQADVNGASVNRVRVGPFNRLDDMNSARAKLADNKIDTAVVKQE